MTVRDPAVAGQFYPASPAEIESAVKRLVDDDREKEKVIGAMSPHAGWQFSGRGAGMLFSRVEIPGTVVVLCPNHRGMGSDVSIQSEGSWRMPTGNVDIDDELAGAIRARANFVQDDPAAHAAEHSLEVQLPIIRHFRPDFRLVPLSLGRVSYQNCEELGKVIAEAVAETGKEVLVVASSDMTHFESAEAAKKKDDMALKKMLELDPKGLYDTVSANRITMCGFIPATIMLVYSIQQGARRAEIVDYRNSGDVTGDYHDVVAYASVIVK